MNIQFTSITQLSNNSWLFQWNAITGVSVYNVVLFGNLIGSTNGLSYNFTLPGYDVYPPQIEVVPSGQQALTQLYPPYLVIQWYGIGVINPIPDDYFGSDYFGSGYFDSQYF